MKRGMMLKGLVLIALILCGGYAFAADDAFAILDSLEKNYIGVERPGLETAMCKAKCSMFPDSVVSVYWAKGKGIKTRVEGNNPATMGMGPMITGYLGTAGFVMKKVSEQLKITKANCTATTESVTLKDGTKATQLTFIPNKGEKLEFTKLSMAVDTKNWVVRESSTMTKDGEVKGEFEYKDNLITKMVSLSAGMTMVITNTYATKDKFTLPEKTELTMDGKDVPKDYKKMTIAYSDWKVNEKIPDGIFVEPKTGDAPKPTESAAELFKQAQSAMMKGDMETAKLKLKQITVYYPDDPMAQTAEMMLKQLPK